MDSNTAVENTVRHLNAGNAVASVQTKCHAGTHRSVAAAEIVAKMLIARRVRIVSRMCIAGGRVGMRTSEHDEMVWK